MISPTIGRVVWYYDGFKPSSQAFPALVCYVHSDHCINLAGFDHNGNHIKATSVKLLQDEEVSSPGQPYACWMPYQKAQAAKNS